MRKDRERVVQLRRLGKSYSEIRQEVRIPKSTLSEWLSQNGWSKRIKKILTDKAKEKSAVHLRKLDKIRGVHLARIYEEARNEARGEFEQFKFHPLFIAGISIYWGEGDKISGNFVRISNVDPLMIRLFVKFLLEVCNAPRERIRSWVLIYPDLDDKKCLDFWIKSSGLRRTNFTKCVRIMGKHKTNKVRFGVCNIGISSKYLKQKFSVWLELLPKSLLLS
ncbi:MAG: hypothetical protein Q7S82_03455 [bacterium]|nr:hypothetical protein [bacterium]